MNRMITAILACISCTLFSGDSAAEAQRQVDLGQLRGLVYFFAPGDLEHQARKVELDRLLTGSRFELHLVKIDHLRVWSEPLALENAEPTEVGDLLVWIDQDRQQARSVAYGQVPTLLGQGMIATDIDESTWGKVKELFR